MYSNKTELVSNKLVVGFLQNNIDGVAKKHYLPSDHKITKTLNSQIITTGKHHVPYG